MIEEMDFQLLYNVNRVNRPSSEIPYWQYEDFDLEILTERLTLYFQYSLFYTALCISYFYRPRL